MYYHLIIQAGGEGTRLMGENSLFPKILKTISGKTIFEHVMQALNPCGQVVIILNEKHRAWEKHFPNFVRTVYSHKTGDLAGISEAIEAAEVLENKRDFPGKILVVWSDLLFGERFSRHLYFREDSYPFQNILFLLADNLQKCRLNFREDFSEDEDEQSYPFPGVFLLDFKSEKIKLFKEWIKHEAHPSFDLVVKQNLQHKFFDKTSVVSEIKQIGTKEEFRVHNKPYSSRSFNTIEFHKSFVVKKSKDKVGLELEYKWLREAYPQYRFDFSRRTCDLEMPLFEHSSKYPKDKLIEMAIQSLHNLHESKTRKEIRIDEGKELLRKAILTKALNRIEVFINNFFIQIGRVDSVEIPDDLKTRLSSLFESILNDLDCEIKYLNFVHGDSTLSNLCLDQDECVWIDPRPPLFESHGFLGFKILDFAKLYYSLSGYEKLNRFELVPRIVDANILIDELDILEEVPPVLPYPNSLLEKFMPFLWLSLAGYAVDTPVEASIAYGIGIKKLLELTR